MKKVEYNIIFGFGGQLIIIILGLIVPRLMITNYGSDTNGLTNTLTQIFSYIALLEAGIGQATRNALYKPISLKNKDDICDVLSASRKYYWKITKFYAMAVILMAVFAPFVLKTNLSWKTVFAVIIFEGMSGVIRFMFTENWMQLLLAEGKGYIQSNINLLTRILSYTIKIILAYLNINIVIIQMGYFCISLVQLIIYKIYINKNYKWLKYNLKSETKCRLKDRNAYVLTEVAWTVFSSTDMVLLSILFSTSLSSVYSVYNMIYSNLSLLLNSVYTGLLYLLGQAFHISLEKYKIIHDEFELIFMTAIAILMSCCSILALPFVSLYTKSVTDINYIYTYLPFLFGLIQILSWDRYVSGNLSGIAGFAKIVCRISVIEALSNVILSIILSYFMGIYGITLATALALIFKLCYLTYLSNKKILNRSVWKSLSKIIVYLVVYSFISLFAIINPIKINTIIDFVFIGIITLISVSLIYLILAFLIDYRSARLILNKLLKKRFS